LCRNWRAKAIRISGVHLSTFRHVYTANHNAGFQAGTRTVHASRFTYSITLNTISITDTGKGRRSVTNDIEAVLRKIEYWH
jgi:hypothetical protein